MDENDTNRTKQGYTGPEAERSAMDPPDEHQSGDQAPVEALDESATFEQANEEFGTETAMPDFDDPDDHLDVKFVEALEDEYEEDTPPLKVAFECYGKQYLGRTKDYWIVENAPDYLSEGFDGTYLTVNSVLMATENGNTVIGSPYVDGAEVNVGFLGVFTTKRVVSFKRRRRKRSSKTTRGFRPKRVVLSILGINVPGFEATGTLRDTVASAEMQE